MDNQGKGWLWLQTTGDKGGCDSKQPRKRILWKFWLRTSGVSLTTDTQGKGWLWHRTPGEKGWLWLRTSSEKGWLWLPTPGKKGGFDFRHSRKRMALTPDTRGKGWLWLQTPGKKVGFDYRHPGEKGGFHSTHWEKDGFYFKNPGKRIFQKEWLRHWMSRAGHLRKRGAFILDTILGATQILIYGSLFSVLILILS